MTIYLELFEFLSAILVLWFWIAIASFILRTSKSLFI